MYSDGFFIETTKKLARKAYWAKGNSFVKNKSFPQLQRLKGLENIYTH